MMKLLQMLSFVITTAGLSSYARAQGCRCDSVEGSVESIFATNSQNGRHLKLRFEANPISRATRLGYLCVDPGTPVALARLWMPEHGHGSSPTRLLPEGTTCTKVERVNFVMSGVWDILVKLADDDSATFSFNVTD